MKFFSRIAIGAIYMISGFFRLNQWRSCRFHPSCSRYSIEAFQKFGFFSAFWLMMKRVSHCHPLTAGGYDPLPDHAKGK